MYRFRSYHPQIGEDIRFVSLHRGGSKEINRTFFGARWCVQFD